MTLYNIVNMSDRYTIRCPDHAVAFVACAILGNGQYAFEPLEGPDPEVPLFILGGAEQWVAKHFNGQTVESVVGQVMHERPLELADAFDSVVIGDRAAFEEATKETAGETFLAARAVWHATHRTSLNDIGGRAYRTAEKLRANHPKPVEAAPQQVFTS
jgi:hypothetical protein